MAQTTGTTKAAAKKALLTADRLREILSYAPNTGEFRWLLTRGRARAGKIAGVVSVYGYRIIRVGGRDYRSARLAWLYMTGAWPLQLVDHIDLNRVNDRWSNLRAARTPLMPLRLRARLFA